MTSLRSRPATSMRSPRRSARAVSWRFDVAVVAAVVVSAMNPQSPSQRHKVAEGQQYSKEIAAAVDCYQPPRAGCTALIKKADISGVESLTTPRRTYREDASALRVSTPELAAVACSVG